MTLDPKKYKTMAGGGGSKKPAAPTKPEPFMTEHSDGTYRQWGEDPKPDPKPDNSVRTYPHGSISGLDMDNLRKLNDPDVNRILQRNAAKPGEVPMYGPDDSDSLKAIVAAHKAPPPAATPAQITKQ